MRSDSSILLLHVGLDLSVLGSFLLFTRWWTTLVLSTRRVKTHIHYTLHVMSQDGLHARFCVFFWISLGMSTLIKCTTLAVTWLCYSLFIEEVKGLGLLCGELGEGAAPLHHAARGVVLHVGLGLHLLPSGGTGGGAKQSAEAAGGEVTESQEGKTEQTGVQGKSKGGEGGHQPNRHPRNFQQHLLYSDVEHAGSCGLAEHFLSCSICVLTKYQQHQL